MKMLMPRSTRLRRLIPAASAVAAKLSPWRVTSCDRTFHMERPTRTMVTAPNGGLQGPEQMLQPRATAASVLDYGRFDGRRKARPLASELPAIARSTWSAQPEQWLLRQTVGFTGDRSKCFSPGPPRRRRPIPATSAVAAKIAAGECTQRDCAFHVEHPRPEQCLLGQTQKV
jgi:hypothetical protein